MHKRWFLGMVAIVFPLILNSTTVVYLTDKDLTRLASEIVEGKCISKQSFWTSDGKRIYTEYKILVSRKLKGKKVSQIFVFRQWGGSVDGFTYFIPGIATFQPGEEVFSFFTPRGKGGFRFTVGLAQGKLRLIRTARGEKYLLRNTLVLKLATRVG